MLKHDQEELCALWLDGRLYSVSQVAFDKLYLEEEGFYQVVSASDPMELDSAEKIMRFRHTQDLRGSHLLLTNRYYHASP